MIVGCGAYEGGARVQGTAEPSAAQRAWAAGALLWVGLAEPSTDEALGIISGLRIPDELVAMVLTPQSRPLLEVRGSTMLLVLHPARYVDEHQLLDFGELAILMTSTAVVTIRRGPFTHGHDARDLLESIPARLARGPIVIVEEIARRVIVEYGTTVRRLYTEIEQVERTALDERTSTSPLRRIAQLKREILDFQSVSTLTAYQLEDLGDGTVPLVPPDERPGFKAIREQLLRHIERADGYRDLVLSVLVSYQTELSIRQNEDMRRISAWVAIAVVPTLIAGIYGMNFDHMPELHQPWGYPAALGVILIVMLSLYRGFRRRGWL